MEHKYLLVNILITIFESIKVDSNEKSSFQTR